MAGNVVPKNQVKKTQKKPFKHSDTTDPTPLRFHKEKNESYWKKVTKFF